jgi:hypothetical protein
MFRTHQNIVHLAIKKSLVRIWLGFFKEGFHRKFYYLMLYHILNHDK